MKLKNKIKKFNNKKERIMSQKKNKKRGSFVHMKK